MEVTSEEEEEAVKAAKLWKRGASSFAALRPDDCLNIKMRGGGGGRKAGKLERVRNIGPFAILVFGMYMAVLILRVYFPILLFLFFLTRLVEEVG